MSAIAGVFARRGRAIPLDRLHAIAARLRPLTPDGQRLARNERVAFVQGGTRGNGSRCPELQPLVTDDGTILSLDGRVDDVAALRRVLGRASPSDATVPELVLAAYRRWGVAGFAHCVGDFALALWDPGIEALVLCRDALGHRPLYSAITGDYAVWASRCRPIADGLRMAGRIDDEFVAGFLLNCATTHSPFRGIEPVPPGVALVVTDTSVEQRRYWEIDPGRTLRYATDAAYAEHLAALLREVIASHADADEPVFAELSGGLDSSAIVCVAEDLRAAGVIRTPSIHTVSYVFDRAATSDERRWIELVEQRIGRSGLHLTEQECPILRAPPPSLYADEPCRQLLFLARHDEVTRRMQAAGARILLSGIGGDQLFWSQPPAALPLADAVAEHRYGAALRAGGVWSRALRWPILRTLWRGAIQPNLPHALRRRTQTTPMAEWLDAGFTRRFDLRGRLEHRNEARFTRPSAALQHALVRDSMRSFAFVWCSSVGDVEERHPFLDRRLVEFALAVPVERSVRPGATRLLFRDALVGVLPETVRLRRTKDGPSEAIYRALVREWDWLEPVFADPLIAQHGFVDRDAFAVALVRARHGLTENEVQLTSAIALELWLRSLEAGEGLQPAPRVDDGWTLEVRGNDAVDSRSWSADPAGGRTFGRTSEVAGQG